LIWDNIKLEIIGKLRFVKEMKNLGCYRLEIQTTWDPTDSTLYIY